MNELEYAANVARRFNINPSNPAALAKLEVAAYVAKHHARTSWPQPYKRPHADSIDQSARMAQITAMNAAKAAKTELRHANILAILTRPMTTVEVARRSGEGPDWVKRQLPIMAGHGKITYDIVKRVRMWRKVS